MKYINLKKIFIMCVVLFVVLTALSTIVIHQICLPYSVNQEIGQIEKNTVTYFGILGKNIIVCLIAISGLYLCKIPSFIVLLINPLFLGLILGANWAATGELVYFLRFIIPHSFFEVPALAFACSIGITGKKGRKNISLDRLLLYSGCILILLIIAAFIETYVSAKM